MQGYYGQIAENWCQMVIRDLTKEIYGINLFGTDMLLGYFIDLFKMFCDYQE